MRERRLRGTLESGCNIPALEFNVERERTQVVVGKGVEANWGQVLGYGDLDARKDAWSILGIKTVKVKHAYGHIEDYPVSKVALLERRSRRNNLWGMLGRCLCSLGPHWFERNPIRKDLLRYDLPGFDTIFGTPAIQRAIKCCERPGCLATKSVYRQGWMGGMMGGGHAGRWKRLSRERNIEIGKLPVI